MKVKCRFCKKMFDADICIYDGGRSGRPRFKCRPCNVLKVAAWKKANPEKRNAQFARYCARKGQSVSVLFGKIIGGSMHTFEVET